MSTTQQTNSRANIKQIISYTLPELYTGKEWYIGFYAFDPIQNMMRRKRIKINFIQGITYGREFPLSVIEEVVKMHTQLSSDLNGCIK